MFSARAARLLPPRLAARGGRTRAACRQHRATHSHTARDARPRNCSPRCRRRPLPFVGRRPFEVPLAAHGTTLARAGGERGGGRSRRPRRRFRRARVGGVDRRVARNGAMRRRRGMRRRREAAAARRRRRAVRRRAELPHTGALALARAARTLSRRPLVASRRRASQDLPPTHRRCCARARRCRATAQHFAGSRRSTLGGACRRRRAATCPRRGSARVLRGCCADDRGPHTRAGRSWAYTRRQALGVCANGAGNYPLQGFVWKAAPALACGNALVFKPALETPLTALAFAELLIEAGAPQRATFRALGEARVGEALVRHRWSPRCRSRLGVNRRRVAVAAAEAPTLAGLR